MMKLALQDLLDFVLDGAEAKLIRAAGPHTPELPQMLLQARALVELLVGGPDELGPEVRKRLTIAQQSIRRPRPDDVRRLGDSAQATTPVRGPRFAMHALRAEVRSVASQSAPAPDSSRISHAQATLSASATPPTARVELERLVIELRRSEAELLPTLVVDLSLSPKRAWDEGWVLWFPPTGTAVRAHFDAAGIARLPWPDTGRGALRVDGNQATLIALEIAP